MELEHFLDECLKKQETKACTPDTGYLLEGCRQLYEAAGAAWCRDFLLRYAADHAKRQTDAAWSLTERFQFGKELFFLYRETEEEVYRSLIEQLRKELVCSFSDAKECYEVLPFYMEYETMFHNKAEYGSIVQCLKESGNLEGTEWYLMALVDVMEHMSAEIFEHYKSLQEIFKETIRGIVPDSGQTLRNACIGYAILKACNMEILNPEKYSETGRKLMDGVIEHPLFREDGVQTGICMMAYAQRVKSDRLNYHN